MKYKEVPDINLRMIIEADIIKAGTTVFAASDESITGVLNSDGSLTMTIDNQTKTFPFPSGAARAITKLSVNGWLFWKIKDDGALNNLKFYKNKYIEAYAS